MKPASNQQIKDVAALKQKKGREESRLILVEGRHPIEEAIKAGLILKDWFYQPGPDAGLPQVDIPVVPTEVDEKQMAKMASTASPPPCLAVFERPSLDKKITGYLVLVLDGIQDPGNLGTLIRSAVAFGVHSIILTDDSVEPYSPKVIRSSAGLVFAVPVICVSRPTLLEVLPPSDWTFYVTTGKTGALPYRQADFSRRCAIVLGNEGQGVSEELLNSPSCQPLTIPMAEAVESLNVGISGSIILAEAAAQRSGAMQTTSKSD